MAAAQTPAAERTGDAPGPEQPAAGTAAGRRHEPGTGEPPAEAGRHGEAPAAAQAGPDEAKSRTQASATQTPQERETERETERKAGREAGREAGSDAEREAERDEAHAEELAYHEEAVTDLAEQIAEERGHRTLYANLFFILLGAVVMAGVTLWGAPKVAPYLPAGVAQYLMPGQLETAERLEALETRLAARAEQTDSAVAGLGERLDALASQVEAAAGAEEMQAAVDEARAIAETAAADAAEATETNTALAERIEGFGARLAGLREEVDAISATLSGTGEGAAPSELAAALAALRARVVELGAAVEGGPSTAELAARIDTLTGRLDEIEGRVADARDAESEVSSAIREARLQSALDTLAGRLAAGQPFAAALGEFVSLAGAEAPAPLAGAAETGLATAAELEASFARRAQAAIAADLRAAGGDSAWGQGLGWLRALVAGRPVTEQAGDDAPAITSRIAARLEEGRLDAALAEAETLSAPAREALGGWLERLRARIAAEAALAAWREQIAAKG
ncbi:MAG TPA: hypothetical protein VMM59_13115 [Thermohalobaculum sp.]|nr:hypothetical protein [Thermohalobaculum sp.]